MEPDTFTAAYPVSAEHRRWAIDIGVAMGILTEKEAETARRTLEAQEREATPPPRPYDDKDYDALGEEVMHG